MPTLPTSLPYQHPYIINNPTLPTPLHYLHPYLTYTPALPTPLLYYRNLLDSFMMRRSSSAEPLGEESRGLGGVAMPCREVGVVEVAVSSPPPSSAGSPAALAIGSERWQTTEGSNEGADGAGAGADGAGGGGAGAV